MKASVVDNLSFTATFDYPMKRAVRYEILRGVSPTSLEPTQVQPSDIPVRVAALLDEKRLLETDGLMEHLRSVFIEDAFHDWMMRGGRFYYFGHAMGPEDVGDIVVVFELDDAEPAA
jgi:hypothetical protein